MYTHEEFVLKSQYFPGSVLYVIMQLSRNNSRPSLQTHSENKKGKAQQQFSGESADTLQITAYATLVQ